MAFSHQKHVIGSIRSIGQDDDFAVKCHASNRLQPTPVQLINIGGLIRSSRIFLLIGCGQTNSLVNTVAEQVIAPGAARRYAPADGSSTRPQSAHG